MDPWWNETMRSVFDGRRVVLAGAVAVAWTEHIPALRAAGATEFLVIATEGRGAGTLPDVPTVVVESDPDLTMMERIHVGAGVLASPPPAVLEALADFDPDRRAVVVGTFLNTSAELDGRPFLSYRRPEWLALEDKVVVDDFWDRAGVDRQPAIVVPLGDAEGAAASIDRGDGTVWAADARDGFHGGAAHTRWVRDRATATQARDDLGAHCDLVRVMPFVEGVPASIHGIVLPDGVVVLRPVEMVVLRPDAAGSARFFYAGCATFFDPPAAIREQMRDVAGATGRHLAAEVGFRGTFTVDGIVAEDGFWPTELNPRFGAGINTIARADLDIPILLLNELIGAGVPLGRSAVDLEADLVTSADAHRGGGTWKGGFPQATLCEDRPLTFADDQWRWATDGDDVAGHVTVAEGFVRCRYVASATPSGPATAPRAARFWAFADRELDTGIGPLLPAQGK